MFPFRIFKKINFLFNVKPFSNFSSQPFGILGAPFSKGQPKEGVEKAPEALRQYGLFNQLHELGIDVKDYGNLNFDENLDSDYDGFLKYPQTVGAACKQISNGVKKVLQDKRKCLTIGGDHSIGIGTVHGHAQVHDVCLLWIDAHADIHTTETSYSGNFHGMTCSFLVDEIYAYNKSIPGFEWVQPRILELQKFGYITKANNCSLITIESLKSTNLAYIGLRDIDPYEKLILTKANILHYSMRDVDKLGIFEVLKRALEAINPRSELSLHVSFDIDSICQTFSPSTGTPVLGGLTVREALSIAEEISSLDCFNALDVVEVNPILGCKKESETTVHVAAMVIKAFLGYSRDGILPKDITNIPVHN